MASNFNNRGGEDTNFSFGVHELRQAKTAQRALLDSTAEKVTEKNQGSDPYNTSGSFDRKKNWLRVGKR